MNLQPAVGLQAVLSSVRAQDSAFAVHVAAFPPEAAVYSQSVVPSLQASPWTVQVGTAQEAAVPAVHLQSPLQSDSDFDEQSSQIVKIIKDFFEIFVYYNY